MLDRISWAILCEIQSKVGPGDALIIVDVQNDFCPGGALPVPNGNEVIPVLNGLINGFIKKALPVVETMDLHPKDHKSFREQGGQWPPHCVYGSEGSQFPTELASGGQDMVIITKGRNKDEDGYSAFENPDLHAFLQGHGVRRLWVGGLATDYCVRATVLDALALGYQVTVVEDGVRAVNVKPGDGDAALAEMRAAGARTFNTSVWY